MKLNLYRHFTNTLIFAVLASVVYMSWSLYMHTFPACLKVRPSPAQSDITKGAGVQDWSELWVDAAFWHILFSMILLVIMILWRPTNNNQRYAFTPLLDASDDEDDEDTLFSDTAFETREALKLRGIESTTKVAKRGMKDQKENTLEVPAHLPSPSPPAHLRERLGAGGPEVGGGEHPEQPRGQGPPRPRRLRGGGGADQVRGLQDTIAPFTFPVTLSFRVN